MWVMSYCHTNTLVFWHNMALLKLLARFSLQHWKYFLCLIYLGYICWRGQISKNCFNSYFYRMIENVSWVDRYLRNLVENNTIYAHCSHRSVHLCDVGLVLVLGSIFDLYQTTILLYGCSSILIIRLSSSPFLLNWEYRLNTRFIEVHPHFLAIAQHQKCG